MNINLNTEAWIGVDLDGTLSHYDGWRGIDHIGKPVIPMLDRVKRWIAQGVTVKIFTARVCNDDAQGASTAIKLWCLAHLGQELPVTNEKDFHMIELWDDRAVQVITNTGQRAGGRP